MFAQNLAALQEKIIKAVDRSGVPRKVELIAVTKTHPAETIRLAYEAGIKSIGENRIQEALVKFPHITDLTGVTRRMIGHLQSNKVKKCLNLFDSVDSVDSLRLAKKINLHAKKEHRELLVLLEVNTSGESSKSGFFPEDVDAMLQCIAEPELRVEGLMTVGPLTKDEKTVRKAFQRLTTLREVINTQLDQETKLSELSMGMSGDFEWAIEEGSTMIRVGTALFGDRNPY